MSEEPPPMDDELPPPPDDIAEEVNHYPEIKVRRSGPFATLRRAVTIFEKDLRTIAKHGLISSIILAISLGMLLYIASYAMTIAFTFQFEDGEDGMSLPGATESIPPVAVAGPDVTVTAGTTVTLDGSDSYDNAEIVYYAWFFWDGARDVELYGETVTYRFMAVGVYEVGLLVVDSSWNLDNTSKTVTVTPSGSDTEPPVAHAGMMIEVTSGTLVEFNGTGSTDNDRIVNWTWTFDDVVPRTLYNETTNYTFENAREWTYEVSLTVRDAAGNTGQSRVEVRVNPTGWDWQPPQVRFDAPRLVSIGDSVTLDASESFDEGGGIAEFTWYVKHNGTRFTLTGQAVTFVAHEWGPYEVVLAVRDGSGNVATDERTIVALPAGIKVDQIPWTATPLGQDVSFNLLTYAYGASLLASVIFVGGLFGKGFAHEIQKGTVKALFFGPVSVTSVIFSKILYPLIIAPVFIYPIMLVTLSPFGQSTDDILLITTVSYLLAAMVMVSAAYGACIIYLVARKMVVKPTVLSRSFMYLSLVGTMTVAEWMSFLFDQWFATDRWRGLYLEHGATIALFSPFHQGGVLLSEMILGTGASPDWWVFIVPVLLIALGVVASRRLYPDLFSRE